MPASSDSPRAVLVEDNTLDQRFAARFASAGLQCELLTPPPSRDDLVAAISSGDYDLVILDYRLDDLPEVGYRGGSIAADLKEKEPLMPVVLFTAVEKRATFARLNPALSEVFDMVIEKGEAQGLRDRRRVARDLIALANGFRTIRLAFGRARTATAQEILVRVMDAQPGELPAETQIQGGGPEAGPFVARQILKSLLRYPGALLDERKTRAFLGLTAPSFVKPETRAWLQPAAYQGVFAGIWARWWKGRVQSLLLDATSGRIPDASTERAKAVAKASSARALKADVCNWCGLPEIIQACEICGEAVDGSHCLTVMDVERPSWADPRLICFVCIQRGRVGQTAFEGPSKEIAQKITTGEIRQEVRNGG